MSEITRLKNRWREEIRQMVRDFYQNPSCSVGGPLHIITDDYNVRNSDLDWCEKHSKEMKGWYFDEQDDQGTKEAIRDEALEIIDALRPFNRQERKIILEGKYDRD